MATEHFRFSVNISNIPAGATLSNSKNGPIYAELDKLKIGQRATFTFDHALPAKELSAFRNIGYNWAKLRDRKMHVSYEKRENSTIIHFDAIPSE